jgi:hypothetical protein
VANVALANRRCVLPALMLRARKESTRRDDSD